MEISQKIHNYNYAPGIATYGAIGKTGKSGENGNNIFYTNIPNIEETSGLQMLATQIANNRLPLKNSMETLDRQYQNGDLFITMSGVIYRLNDIATLKEEQQSVAILTKYFSVVGKVTVDNASYFEYLNNGRLAMNTQYKGFDIINTNSDATNYVDTNSAMNIISDEVDKNNNVNILKMTAINTGQSIINDINIYYNNNDNAFHIETGNVPVVINSDAKINNETQSVDIDGYSTILTSNDTITSLKNLCQHIKWFAMNNPINDNERLQICLQVELDYKTRFAALKDNLCAKIYTNDTTILLILQQAITEEGEDQGYYIYACDTLFNILAEDVIGVSLLNTVEVMLDKTIL